MRHDLLSSRFLLGLTVGLVLGFSAGSSSAAAPLWPAEQPDQRGDKPAPSERRDTLPEKCSPPEPQP